MPLVNNQSWDRHGGLVADAWIDVPYPPLEGPQVAAALNAALGLWGEQDASNIAGVPVDHLVAEVEAWAYVSDLRGNRAEVL